MTGRRLIQIQFTRPTGFKPLSWTIRKVQRTDYSHVRLAWDGISGTVPVIYEASGSNLKFIGPIAAAQHKVKVINSFKFNLPEDQYRALVKLCMTYANVDYGKKQLIGIGLVKAFRLKKNPFADGRKSQVCSEVIGMFLTDILGHDLGLDLDIAGPKEIMETIVKIKQRKD